MSNRRSFIERDSRGRLVNVRSSSHHRSSSHGRKSTRELLNEAEEREQILIGEMQSLRAQLSFAQQSEWHLENLRREHRHLLHEHSSCQNTQAQLEDNLLRVENILHEEEHENRSLKSKYDDAKQENRLLKRTSGESYRARYEEKTQEVELLRLRLGEKDAALRVADRRITEKNSMITYLKDFLRRNGFRVED